MDIKAITNRETRIADTTTRYASLYALGMARSKAGFSFRSIKVSIELIEKSIDDEWAEILNILTINIRLNKKIIDREIKSDRIKLNDFVRSLEQITGPELRQKESQEVLEGALSVIGMARDYVKVALDKELKVYDSSIN